MKRIACAFVLAFCSAVHADTFRYSDGYFQHEVDVTADRIVMRERTGAGIRGDLSCAIGPGLTAPAQDPQPNAFCVRFPRDRCTYTRFNGKNEPVHDQEWARAGAAPLEFCVEMATENALTLRGLVNRTANRRTMAYSNGDRYEGEMVDLMRHGRGAMVFANGVRYEGEWRDNLVTGRGVMTWPNGDRFDGDLVNGIRNGQGAMRFSTGVTYDGEWRNDRMTGRGVMTWPNRDRYEGDLVDGVRNGRGTMRYGDGGQYDGDWRNDQHQGTGIMVWPNGQRYSGEWAGGSRHGRGTHVIAPGRLIEGEWADDRPMLAATTGDVASTAASNPLAAQRLVRDGQGPAAGVSSAGQASSTVLTQIQADRSAGDDAERAGDARAAFERYVSAFRLTRNLNANDAALAQAEILARMATLLPKVPALSVPEDAARRNRRAGEILQTARSPDDVDRAAQELSQAAYDAPWIAALHLNRARVLERAGSTEDALQAMRVYLALKADAPDREEITQNISELQRLADERRAWLPFIGTWTGGAFTQRIELRGRELTSRVVSAPPGGRYLPGEVLMHGTIDGTRFKGKVFTRPVDTIELKCFGRDQDRDADGGIADGKVLTLRWLSFNYTKDTCQIVGSEWKPYLTLTPTAR